MVKNPPAAGDLGSIPGSGRSPGEENGPPLWYSCLGNPMDRGAWQATVLEVSKELDTTEGLTPTLLLITQRSQDGPHRPSLAVPRGQAQHYEAILQMRRSRLPANMLAELRQSGAPDCTVVSLRLLHPGAQVPAGPAGRTVRTRAGRQGGGRAFRGRVCAAPARPGRRGQAGSSRTAQSKGQVQRVRRPGGGGRAELPGLGAKAWGPEALGGFTPSWEGAALPQPAEGFLGYCWSRG